MITARQQADALLKSTIAIRCLDMAANEIARRVAPDNERAYTLDLVEHLFQAIESFEFEGPPPGEAA